MRPLQEVLSRLPKEEREEVEARARELITDRRHTLPALHVEVEARARELITEEMTLRALRQACDPTRDQTGGITPARAPKRSGTG